MFKTIKRAILFLIAAGIILFGLIQLVPYGRNHSNPPVVREPNWDSPQTRQLAERACFDCHSNQTVWPWYTNIAPFSWLIQNDVDEGRQRLNFSNYTGVRELDEVSEVVLEGKMPPLQYLLIHPNANLNSQEKQLLAGGLAASLAQR